MSAIKKQISNYWLFVQTAKSGHTVVEYEQHIKTPIRLAVRNLT